jgi:hypothetical protein
MADPTLAELLGPDDEDSMLTFLLTQLASLGFPTVNWQSGRVIYTMLKSLSRSLATTSTLLQQIASGGLLKLSTGGWLTLLADWYSSPALPVARFPAVHAEGVVRFTTSAGNGPNTVTAGQMIVQDAVTKRRYISNNPTPITLPVGVSVADVPVVAEFEGASANVPASNAVIMVTPLVGVIANFQAQPGSVSWLTVQGQDEESDKDLITRCRAKWGTVGAQKPADAYLFLATHTPGIGTVPTKTVVRDNNPRGPGTIDIWLAALAGPLPTVDELAIRAYLISLASPSADLLVQNATVVTIGVTATLYYEGQYADTVALAEDNILTLINAMPIGGTLLLANVIEALMAPPGARNTNVGGILINGSNADLTVGHNEVAAAGTITISPVVVVT